MNPYPSTIRSLIAVGAGVALTLAACGGGDDDSADATVPAPATTESPAATVPAPTTESPVATVPAVTTDETDPADDTSEATPAGDNAITIADFAFDGVTEVAVGTTVVVTNTDSAPHTWSAVDGTFDSGALGGGETFEFTFDTPGEFEYFCNFHPSMSGTITVTG